MELIAPAASKRYIQRGKMKVDPAKCFVRIFFLMLHFLFSLIIFHVSESEPCRLVSLCSLFPILFTSITSNSCTFFLFCFIFVLSHLQLSFGVFVFSLQRFDDFDICFHRRIGFLVCSLLPPFYRSALRSGARSWIDN